MATFNTTDPKPGYVYDVDTDTWYPLLGLATQTLDGLTDVIITSPATNQSIVYNGTNWVNSTEVGDISGVTAGTGISGGGTSGTVTITNSMATAIDAKGDLIAGTGADAFAKLSVGTNDQILVADSTAVTGMKWATPSSGSKSWSLLNTGGTALSGSTTTISGISGKDNLLILIEQADVLSSPQALSIRFNSDSGNNYIQVGISLSSTPSIAGNSLITYDSFVLGDNNTNTGKRSGYFIVSGANSTGLKAVNYATMATAGGGGITGGVYTGTSTISSISILTGGSTFDGGTIFVYGAE